MSVEIAPRIVADPAVRFGRPVIKGTRVPVDLVVAKLVSMSKDEVAAEYDITLDDIRAALSYATCVRRPSESQPGEATWSSRKTI
jgi:uncharacterized protein (DUF433 family)